MQQYDDDSRYSRRPEESDMVTAVQIMCSARIEFDMISMCPDFNAIDIELAPRIRRWQHDNWRSFATSIVSVSTQV